MTGEVVLIDYGSGNLRSAEKALVRVLAQSGDRRRVLVTDDPEAVAGAERLMLPGVGAFRACMDALRARDGLIEAMTHAVHGRDAPFLGVCVGMQLLASRGLEFGEAPGLGWIDGEVRILEPANSAAKVPHMGWNDLRAGTPHPLIGDPGQEMYFTHSYGFFPVDPDHVIASFEHGGNFVAAVAQDNVAGVQFHPEKSQVAGLAMIHRFLEWRP